MAQNPLYNLLGGNMLPKQLNGFMSQLEAFKKQYKGDPKTQIQQMLDSGQISQTQYNQAVQMANALSQMFKG